MAMIIPMIVPVTQRQQRQQQTAAMFAIMLLRARERE
jgi:hypothetical protein